MENYDVIQLCSDLIRIPSVTDDEAEVKPVEAIEKILVSNGITCKIVGKDRKKSLVATIGEGKKSVMFNSHFDVVPAPSESLFTPIVQQGKLYGRGSADAKGPLSAMIMAFLSLKEIKKLNGKVILCAVCDEEKAGELGTKVLAENNVRANYSIFGEPTNFKVIVAEKGFLRLKITCLGKEAHAAFPDDGVNAIKIMSDIVQEIEQINWSSRHKLLSGPTVSYGLINGGSKINVVAGVCELSIDIRYLPDQKETEIIRQISKIANKHGRCQVSKISSGLPLETAVTSPLVKAACEEVGGKPVGVSFATDARFYQNQDCIVLGPGKPELAHQANENISVSDLEKAVEVYRDVTLKLLS